MFYVIEKAFAPTGEQIDSYDIATYNTETEAVAHAERLGIAQDKCPPNDDEPRCVWFAQSVN